MKLLGPFIAGILLTTIGLAAVAMMLVDPVDAGPRAYTIVDAPDTPEPATASTVDVAVRDVTPEGLTRRVAAEGTLVRIEAREAEAEAAEPIVPTTRYDRIVILDAGHFRAIRDGVAVVVRIADVEAPSFDYICGALETENFATSWRCGAAARAELARLVGVRSVECVTLDESDPSVLSARCSVGGHDIATWLVAQGWAMPRPGVDRALVEASEAARAGSLGLNRDGDSGFTATTL
jgi:endonuclease YncB( thermonuclease family)